MLYFLYPQFFFFGTQDDYTLEDGQKALNTGDRQEYFETESVVNSLVHSVALTTDWFGSAGKMPDSLVIARADILRRLDSADVNVYVQGSDVSDFDSADETTDTPWNDSFGLDDLIGKRSEDYFGEVIATTERKYWRVTITTTDAVKHRLSKIYLCEKLYLGREPLETSAIIYPTEQVVGNREQARSFRLDYIGIEQSVYEIFRKFMINFKGTNPIFLYSSTTTGIFGTEKLIHATIKSVTSNPRTLGKYDMTITLEEAI